MNTTYQLSPIPEIHELKVKQYKRLSKLSVKRLRLLPSLSFPHTSDIAYTFVEAYNILDDEIQNLKFQLSL